MPFGRRQKYIDDVSMEIDPRHYPPPLVFVPDIPLIEPIIPQYDFAVERTAIRDYERFNCSTEPPTANSTGFNSKLNMSSIPDALTCLTTKAETSHSKFSAPSSKLINPILVSNTSSASGASSSVSKPMYFNDILEPSRVALIPKPKLKVVANKTDNPFEEFEPKPNLFDLLEMRTIDDKSLLEQILNASVPEPKVLLSSNEQHVSPNHAHSKEVSATLPMRLSRNEQDNNQLKTHWRQKSSS